jgi:hypothetical protein
LREQRRGQDGRSAQQSDGHDGHHERAGGADSATEDLRLEILEPRPVIVPPSPIRDGGRVDPLIQVRRGRRRRQAAEQRQQSRGPADLGRADRASLDVGRESRCVRLEQVVDEERVDQAACASVIQGLARGRSEAHIL